MARFNEPAATLTRTLNRAGGEAFVESPRLALASLLVTSFVNDQFYRSADEAIEETIALMNALPDPRFAAKAAIVARRDFGMRSISHVVAAELPHLESVRNVGHGYDRAWLVDFYPSVVERVDDVTEILSYWLSKYGKPLPQAMKRGLARALSQFDRYQLAKYRGEGKAMRLVDAFSLLRPEPRDDEQTTNYRDLMHGKLTSAGETWEAEITAAEGDPARVADAWTRLVGERKIGHFALLRNLRNIIEQAPAIVPAAAALLADEQRILSSKVLPFRYASAFEALDRPPREIVEAINRAIDVSLRVVKLTKLEGRTLVALDASRSMTQAPYNLDIKRYSTPPIKHGSLFAAVLVKGFGADFMEFAQNAWFMRVNYVDSTMGIARAMEADATIGQQTDFRSIFNALDRPYDRIVILSDMQGWVGRMPPTRELNAYRERIGADPAIFSFDLAGYGTLQLPERRVFALAGFSEKALEIMNALEQDQDAFVNRIESMSL